jgi:hypothetical protein
MAIEAPGAKPEPDAETVCPSARSLDGLTESRGAAGLAETGPTSTASAPVTITNSTAEATTASFLGKLLILDVHPIGKDMHGHRPGARRVVRN